MKLGSWEECVQMNLSLKVSVDKAKVRSLLAAQKLRNKFLEASSVNDPSSNFVFEGYYSSVLELLHALVLLEGYNVKNHVCLGFYLRDVLKNEELFRIFSWCRFQRNSLVYYGKIMKFEIAKEAISKCKKLIKELSKLI